VSQKDESIITQLVTEFAVLFTTFQRDFAAIKSGLKIDTHEFQVAKQELDSCIRSTSILITDLVEKTNILRGAVETEAGKVMVRTMKEIDVSIRKMTAESIKDGVVAGTEQAIKDVFNKALENLNIEVANTIEQINKLKKSRKQLGFIDFINASSTLANWVIGIGFGGICIFTYLWFFYLIPLEKKATLTKSAYYMQAATAFDDDLAKRVDDAYKKAVLRDKDTANLAAQQANLKKIASQKAQEAAEAQAAADLAIEIQAKQQTATLAAKQALKAAQKADSGN